MAELGPCLVKTADLRAPSREISVLWKPASMKNVLLDRLFFRAFYFQLASSD
jgi:hypothetical protein